MSKKVSPINELSVEDFQLLVSQHNTLASILKHFNLLPGAGNYKTLKKRILKDKIDISHIKLGLNSNKGKSFTKKLSSKDILVANKFVNGITLKRVIFRENLLLEQCSKCGLGNIWQGEKITLTLDHIDGNNRNNLIQNLRILCPNCHSQTSTFSGRNIKNKKSWNNYCKKCNKKLNDKNSIHCRRCNGFDKRTKINWPTIDQLLLMLENNTAEYVANVLGVSSNAIRARLKRRGITSK